MANSIFTPDSQRIALFAPWAINSVNETSLSGEEYVNGRLRFWTSKQVAVYDSSRRQREG
jgi:hypothetical protein